MIRALAEKALDEIERTPKHQVYASIKGVVAAYNDRRGNCTVFRREENGQVNLETTKSGYYLREYPLPLDLQFRAAKMLDNL